MELIKINIFYDKNKDILIIESSLTGLGTLYYGVSTMSKEELIQKFSSLIFSNFEKIINFLD